MRCILQFETAIGKKINDAGLHLTVTIIHENER